MDSLEPPPKARFSVFKKLSSTGLKRKAGENTNICPSSSGGQKPTVSQPALGDSADNLNPPTGGPFRFAMSRSSFAIGRTPPSDTPTPPTRPTRTRPVSAIFGRRADNPPEQPPRAVNGNASSSSSDARPPPKRMRSSSAGEITMAGASVSRIPSLAIRNGGLGVDADIERIMADVTTPNTQPKDILPKTTSLSRNQPLYESPASGAIPLPTDDFAPPPSPSRTKSATLPAARPSQTRPPSILLSPRSPPSSTPITLAVPNPHGDIETVPRERPHLGAGTLPPRPISRVTMSGGARLSPSITMRQPMPIMNLPPLPAIPTPAPEEGTPRRPNGASRLRSMPTLSLVGSGGGEAGGSADHDNAALDSDDEEEDHEDETPEDEAGAQAQSTSPRMRTPRLDLGSLRPTRAFSVLGTATPMPGRIMDYFTSKPREPVERPSTTPPEQDTASTAAGESPVSMRSPGPPSAFDAAMNRPGLRHRNSKSMVDIRVEEAGPSVARRTSMPSLKKPPPAYAALPPSLRRGFTRLGPREDEGREELPGYDNRIHLVAVMPRKMEFEAPGVQAGDRKWRRLLCELEGTVFRVYPAPKEGRGVLEWWEKRVGVGDRTVVAPLSSAVKTETRGELVREPKAEDGQPAQEQQQNANPEPQTQGQTPKQEKRRSKLGSLFHSSASRVSMDATREREPSATRTSTGNSPPSANGHGHGRGHGSTPSLSTGRSSFANVPVSAPPTRMGFDRSSSDESREAAVPERRECIRAYTMQNAESGLGSDYVKRKNVIRVRMEGEQFLLQAPDVAAVVEWIEGFQAAQNIALDLDERPMPKPPLFPRRRRRRARAAQATNGDAGANGDADADAENANGRGRPRTPPGAAFEEATRTSTSAR